MDFSAIYHFIFETYWGMGVLVAIFLVASVIACAIWEVRTRKIYKNHEKKNDEWSLFDDDEEEGKDE